MATVVRIALAIALACSACGKLEGFGGPVPPLATLHVEVTGDLGPLRPPGDTGTPNLQVALVWGKQWVTEALCILPPENAQAGAAITAGCRDPFGFVPARVEANVPVEIGVPSTIELSTLPGADVMVGDVTARVAYGTLVVYDDRNATGTLELARPNRLGNNGPPMEGDTTPTILGDVVYGASFVTMTEPDQRVAYREGAFDPAAAFYPRAGCGAPPPAFSIVAAGGFSYADAIAALAMGQLPQEDPATCAESAPDTLVTIPVRAPAGVQEVACTERLADSSVRYRDPADEPPDLTNRVSACVHLPTFSGPPSSVIQLVVSGTSSESCKGLTHYVLRGCSEDPGCPMPDWDHTAAPPSWWPCPVQGVR